MSTAASFPEEISIRAAFPIGDTPPRFVARLSGLGAMRDHPLAFAPNASQRRDGVFEPRMQSLAAHFAESLQDLGDGLVCAEAPMPSCVGRALSTDTPSQDGFAALVHAGRAGALGPLHFDWDHQWVLQVCLSGAKRFLLFPPSAGWLLSPRGNHAALDPVLLEERDRVSLVERLGGVEVRIRSGEAVLFPSSWWHGVIYEEAGTAASLRFGRHVALRPWCVFAPHWRMQRLVSIVMREPSSMSRNARWLSALADAMTHAADGETQSRNLAARAGALLSEAGLAEGARFWRAAKFDDSGDTAPACAEGAFDVDLNVVAAWLGDAYREVIAASAWRDLFLSLASIAAATRRGLPYAYQCDAVTSLDMGA